MPDLITLRCPTCGGKITTLPNSSRVVCEYCGNEHIVRGLAHPEPQSRGPAPQPAEIAVEREGRSLTLVRRWFSWKYIPLLFFCIAWDGFLLFWYSMAFSGKAPWIMIVFPMAHVAVGVWLTYSTVAGFFNRTYVEITPQEIAVWHDPFPWPGEATIATPAVKQIYCKEKVSQGRRSTSYHYDLYVVLSDGRARKLVSGLESPDVALFIEQQMEGWLRIPDRPVPGELER